MGNSVPQRHTRSSHLPSVTSYFNMHLTKSLLPILLFLFPCCLSKPRFLSTQQQVEKCFSGFYRCCSSTRKIPLRCFEINQCPIHFSSLQNYNSICSKIYDDANGEEDISETKVEALIKDDSSASQLKYLIEEEMPWSNIVFPK